MVSLHSNSRRAKTIEEILSHVTTGLPKSSAAISAKREVISRPVTRTYPSKRGNRQKPLDFSSNRSGSMSCGNGASIPRPNSPYRVPSDIRDVVDPVSVFQFLTGLGKEEGKYEVEKIDLTAEAPSEVMNHLEGDCSSTAKKLKEPNYVSANKLNNNTGNHRGKAPLSPVKVIQHKRYPGMLTSPERKCKAIAPIVCESKSSSLDGGQQLMVQTPKDGKADLDTAMDDQELEGVTNSDGLTSANMTIVELK